VVRACFDVSCSGARRFFPLLYCQGSWFEVEKETLLCLLGPTGPAEVPTINCLTGIIPTSAGDGQFPTYLPSAPKLLY